MNINFSNILLKNIPNTIYMPNRAQIFVGLKCSQNCGFCFYGHCKADKMFKSKYVFKQIDLELACGKTDFEFIGGEPGECNDLELYCKYIKEKSANSRISVITNGELYKLTNVWQYLDEILISYHLSRYCTNYDKRFFPMGNTYDKVEKCVKLAKKNNLILRFNILVGNFNLNDILNITDEIISFEPNIINFLTLDIQSDAADLGETYLDLNIGRHVLKCCINKIKKYNSNILTFIKFIPFCDMEGYEQHVVGKYQFAFDWFDWNRMIDGEQLIKKLDTMSNEQLINEILNFRKERINILTKQLKSSYIKHDKCKECKYYLICQGLNNDDVINNIKPVFGKYIKNPMEFIDNNIQKMYFNN